MGPSASRGPGGFESSVVPRRAGVSEDGDLPRRTGNGPRSQATTWLAPATAMAFVRRIAEQLVGVTDLSELARTAARTAADAVGAEVVAVHVVGVNGTALEPVLVEGAPEGPAYPEVPTAPVTVDAPAPVAAIVRRGAPSFWPTPADRDRQYPELADHPGSDRSWAVLPLMVRGTAVGALTFGLAPQRRLGPADAGFLETVADQCAEAVDRVRTGAALRAERDVLALLSDGTRLMVGASEPSAVVDRLVRLAVPRLAPWCAVYVAERGVLRRVAVEIEGRPYLAAQLRGVPAVAVDEPTVLGEVLRTGRVQVVPFVDEAYIRDLYSGPQATAMLTATAGGTSLIVPVKAAGEVIGAMSLFSPEWQGSPPAAVIQGAEGLAARAGMALAGARQLADERRTAAALTRALLPAELPHVPGYQVAARYRPAGSPVAGDWYDLARLPSGRYMLGVGDSGGHGIPAASLMAQLRNAARGLAVAGSSPGRILHALNLLTVGEGQDTFATAVYAVLDPGSGAVVWSSAGHLPPLLYRGGTARYVDRPSHPPLGWPTARPAPESTLHLGEGNSLVLVTDGVVERRGGDLAEGMEQLRQVVARYGALDVDGLTECIVATIGPDPVDDCCVLVVRRPTPGAGEDAYPSASGTVCDDRPVTAAPSRSERADAAAGAGGREPGDAGPGRSAEGAAVGPSPPPEDSPELPLPPRPTAAGAARRWVSHLLADWPPAALETARLLLSEVVTNAVLHARTPIEVRMVSAGAGDRAGRVRLEVADGLAEGPLPKHFEPDADTGRGLTLVASLADGWGVRRSPEGKVVWFIVGPGSGADCAGEVAAAQLLVDLDDWVAHGDPQVGLAGHPSTQPVGDLLGRAGNGGEAGTALEALASGGIEGRPGRERRLVQVRVLGVPLALYLETEQHNDALVRELGLIVEPANQGDDRTEVPGRLFELAGEIRSVFRPVAADTRAQIERAVQLGHPTVDLVMTMPPVGWEMLLRLIEQLDEADRYCEQGELLTLSSTPAVRRLRRWYAQQVADQLAGRPPRRWSADDS